MVGPTKIDRYRKNTAPFVNHDPRVDQIGLDIAIGRRFDRRLDETLRNVIALHKIDPSARSDGTKGRGLVALE